MQLALTAALNLRHEESDTMLAASSQSEAETLARAPFIDPSFTENGVVYASSTSALATSSAFTFNGTDVGFTGNLVPGTAAKGINFTANTPASGMTSQLLNWYEEGTFTPTITFSGASVGITYSTQNGLYTRIGDVVHVIANVRLTSKGSSTGTANIAGLPYSQRTLTDGEAAISIQANNFAATVITQVMGYVVSGSNTILFQRFSAGTAVTLADTDFANNTIVRVRVSYFI